MLVLIAVGGDEVGAVGGAVNGDFALCAAANGADFLALGRAEASGLALFTNRTRHEVSQTRKRNEQNTPCGNKRQNQAGGGRGSILM